MLPADLLASNMSDGAKLTGVIMHIMAAQRGDGMCALTAANVAKMLAVHERTVKRYFHELVDGRWIKRVDGMRSFWKVASAPTCHTVTVLSNGDSSVPLEGANGDSSVPLQNPIDRVSDLPPYNPPEHAATAAASETIESKQRELQERASQLRFRDTPQNASTLVIAAPGLPDELQPSEFRWWYEALKSELGDASLPSPLGSHRALDGAALLVQTTDVRHIKAVIRWVAGQVAAGKQGYDRRRLSTLFHGGQFAAMDEAMYAAQPSRPASSAMSDDEVRAYVNANKRVPDGWAWGKQEDYGCLIEKSTGRKIAPRERAAQ